MSFRDEHGAQSSPSGPRSLLWGAAETVVGGAIAGTFFGLLEHDVRSGVVFGTLLSA